MSIREEAQAIDGMLHDAGACLRQAWMDLEEDRKNSSSTLHQLRRARRLAREAVYEIDQLVEELQP